MRKNDDYHDLVQLVRSAVDLLVSHLQPVLTDEPTLEDVTTTVRHMQLSMNAQLAIEELIAFGNKEEEEAQA